MPTAWKGTISFGLVNIPITLYPAFKSKDIEFHLLHRDDQGRIGYQKICKKCGKILKPEDIVKAYEHEKDAYIPMEKEELEEGKAPNTRNLEISIFVKEDEIDTKLYERPYYVMPAKNAENLYVLLREAIRASGMIGVGKIQFGNKEHLAALKCDGPAILLNLMHFMDELEDPKLLNFPAVDAPVGKKELDLARQLVSTLKGEFDPEEFRNTHRDRLEEAVQGKIDQEAKTRRKAGAAAGDRKVIDLMERLKESLAKGGGDWSPAPPARAGTRGTPKAKAHAKAGDDREPAAEKHYRRKKAG
jgi:DNA end-binding protein Ku